jgi:drug/metabolite transporter (DMT)-like permease
MKAMQLSTNNAKTGSLIFIAPFISLIFISAILKEKIHGTTIAGLILIVSGIVWQQFFIKNIMKKVQSLRILGLTREHL